MIGYGICAIEMGVYFIVSFLMKKLCVPFHKINNIVYYWLCMTILTGIWESSYIVNFNEITTMSNSMIVNNTHSWTTQYDFTYVNPWKFAKIFYAEYGAWADREYMYQIGEWSDTIKGTHLIFCAVFSFFGFIARFDKKSVKSLIVVGMVMVCQIINSILYMVQYIGQTQQSFSVNYYNSSWPLGTLMINRPFMYVNIFWIIIPTFIMFYEIFNVQLDNGYFTISYTHDNNDNKYVEQNHSEPPSYDDIKYIDTEREPKTEPETEPKTEPKTTKV